jgi:hypothetical protein
MRKMNLKMKMILFIKFKNKELGRNKAVNIKTGYISIVINDFVFPFSKFKVLCPPDFFGRQRHFV